MLDEHADHEETAIGWMSMADLFMVGLMTFLLFAGVAFSRNEQLKADVERLSVECIAMRDDLVELARIRDENASLVLENSSLRDKLADTEMDADNLDRLLQEAECQITLLRSENAAHTAALAEAQSIIAKQHLQLEEIRLSLARAERQITSLRMDLQKAQTALCSLAAAMGVESLADEDLPEYVEELDRQLRLLRAFLTRAGVLSEEEISQLNLPSLLNHARKRSVQRDAELIEIARREQRFRQELLGIQSRNGRFGRVVFIVDRSGSMGDPSNNGGTTRWNYVRGVIEDWLLLLPFEQVQLILFNNKVDVFPADGYLSLADTAVKRPVLIEEMLQILKDTVPVEGTHTLAALQKAYEAENADAIFLFTDGQPMLKAERYTTSDDIRVLQNQVLDLVAAQTSSGNRIPINVIALGDYFHDKNKEAVQKHLPFGVFMTTIAQRSGGAFLGR